MNNSLAFNLRSHLVRNSNDIESLAIETINKKSKNVVVSAQCRQLAGNFKQYKTYLEDFFNGMKNSIKAMYIVDDINLSLIDHETNVEVRNDLKLLFQDHFIPAINKLTQQCSNG